MKGWIKTIAFGLVGIAVIFGLIQWLVTDAISHRVLLFIGGVVWGYFTYFIAIDRGWVN